MIVWFIQAIWVFAVAMPMLFVNGVAPVSAEKLNPGDWVCIVGFAMALVFEVTADVQKARWVSAGRPGGFCNVGVWSWSRHPNYCGEILRT